MVDKDNLDGFSLWKNSSVVYGNQPFQHNYSMFQTERLTKVGRISVCSFFVDFNRNVCLHDYNRSLCGRFLQEFKRTGSRFLPDFLKSYIKSKSMTYTTVTDKRSVQRINIFIDLLIIFFCFGSENRLFQMSITGQPVGLEFWLTKCMIDMSAWHVTFLHWNGRFML